MCPCVLQDMPYAFFGTCLGAIVAYETVRTIARKQTGPPPVAFFPAAVSPPHIYAGAVAKLYLAQGETLEGQDLMASVMEKLKGWELLPRELLMQVGHLQESLLSAHMRMSRSGRACVRQRWSDIQHVDTYNMVVLHHEI